MTQLDDARTALSSAADLVKSLERRDREAMGYPEPGTDAWYEHQLHIALRYSQLKPGQYVRLWRAPHVQGTDFFGGVEGTYRVGRVLPWHLELFERTTDGLTMCIVDCAHASYLLDFEVVVG